MISSELSVNKYEQELQKMKAKSSFKIQIETPIEHKELKQNGYTIHYYSSGDTSKELIIFLHPAFADHRCFDKQIDFFSKHYRVVTIDMLGHGLSKVADAKDKIDASVNHIDAIIKKEGYGKAHFVGVSMGTLIAQYYGLNHPEKVISMSLLGGYDINADNKEIEKAQRSENIKWLFKAIFSMNSFRKYTATVSLLHAEEQARFYEMAQLFTRKSFMSMSGLGKVIQIRENVKHTYPLFIMCGDNDIELSRRMNEKWHASNPASKFHMLKNAGHCANMDNSSEFNEIVMGFVRGSKTR